MNTSKITGQVITGISLVVFGALALVGNFFEIWGYIWPLALLAFGAIFFISMARVGPVGSGLAIPGSILTTLGLILLVQTLTQNWGSWSYAWGLILVGVGIGTHIHGRVGGDMNARKSGRQLATLGFIFFILFGAFFELGGLIRGLAPSGDVLWPLALIGLGLYTLITRIRGTD
jgi:hypothetical protein